MAFVGVKRIYTYLLLIIIIVLSVRCTKDTDVYLDIPANADKELFFNESGADMNFYTLYKNEVDEEKKMQYAEIFIDNIREDFSHPVIAGICDTLAQYYEKKARFSDAIELASRSLQIYSIMKDEGRQAECRYLLARLYYKKAEYHNVLLMTTEALKQFKTMGNELRVLDCYNLLGIVFQICNDFETSKKFFAQYVEGVRKHRDTSRFVYALNNAAVLENTLRDSVKTRELIEESLKIAENMKDTSVMSQVRLNSAGICMNIGLYADAQLHLDKVSAMLDPDNIEQMGIYYQYRGLLMYYGNDIEAAISFIKTSILHYSKGEFEHKIRDCYMWLQMLYELENDTENAYICLKKYHEISSLINQDRVYLDLFKAQNQVILSWEREKHSRQKGYNVMILCLIIIVTIMTVAVTMLNYRKKKNQILIQEAKLEADRELFKIRDMQKFQMDKLMEDLTCRLNILSSQTKDAVVKAGIGSILSDLRISCDEKKWKELSHYIPDSESEFICRLVRDFPDLSTNERRLCVLLNKNLSTKEIAEITRQSPKSINVARTRLRNKLGLTGSDMLIQDLLSNYSDANSESGKIR